MPQGRNLSPETVKRIVQVRLENPELSDRVLADRFGVSIGTVNNITRRMKKRKPRGGQDGDIISSQLRRVHRL